MMAGLAALVMTRQNRKGHLDDGQRRELAERCRALGIPSDEINALVLAKDDHALIARHRAEHRMLAVQKPPYR